MSKGPSAPSTAALTVYRLAALFTFLAVAMGAVVCATRSGASCPTWPGCRHSTLTPQWELSPVVEFTHRVVAVTAGPLLLAAALMGGRLARPDRWLRIAPWVAVVGALASGFFGRLVIVSTLPVGWAGVDLSCALIAMTVMAVAAVRAGAPATASAPRSAADRGSLRVSRLALAGVAVVVPMHVTGLFTAATGSFTGCVGWPLWQRVASDVRPWLQGARFGLAVLAAVVVVLTAAAAVRVPRLRRWGLTLGALFVAEMVIGVVISRHGIDNGVASAYSVVAAALLWCLGLLTAVAGLSRTAPDAVPVEVAPALG